MTNYTVIPGTVPEVSIEELWKEILHAVVRNEDGVILQWRVDRANIAKAREAALAAHAVANAIENYLDSEEHATKLLTERRNAWAVKLGSSPLGYDDTFDSTKRAIDGLIELEDKLRAVQADNAKAEEPTEDMGQ